VNVVVAILVVLFGLAFGSFLNVCISRLPQHESIVAPRSRCPECGAQIGTGDNIPLLSFVLLRGRCRSCGMRISWRYPMIELATAALFLLSFLEFGWTLQALGIAMLCFLLLGLAAMDAETLMLPDAFTLPGIGLGILYSGAICAGVWTQKIRCAALSLGWALAGAGVMLAIRGLYWLVRRREGMGVGDAKLLAMIAAWLGAANSVLVFFLGVVGAALYGIVVSRSGRDGAGRGGDATRVPLGYFLCAAALFAAFKGEPVIRWYMNFFR
jgi:leader peptidase (prepilin peptidase) / N-methyltransferase